MGPVERLLPLLENVRGEGPSWMARCPTHDDRRNSLSVREGDDGRALVHCFAGCTPEAIVTAVGLTMADLFPAQERAAPRVVAETDYCICDVHGEVQGIHRRRDYSDRSKAVSWSLPDGTRGLGGRAIDSMPLYGSEDLMLRPEDSPILCEGEKAAQALRDVGYLALGTVTGAALAPSREVLATFQGRREVLLWPDRDVPGVSHMMKIGLALAELGVPFRQVIWPGAPEKGDAYDFIAQGGDVDALLAAATAPAWNREAAPTVRASRIVRVGDCRLEPPDYLIDGMLVRDSLAALVAKEASYKSFVAIGMAAAIFTGGAFAGCAAERGSVLYLAAEGAGGMGRRVRAWEIAHGGDLSDLRLLPCPVNFLSDGDLGDLEADIAALPEVPALLVVDTLSRNFGGANENAPEYMTRFIAACDRLRMLTGACVLIVHHESKHGGYRGHSSFAGALDTLIEVKREGTAVTLSCKKQKDDAEFAPVHLAARVIDLGFADRHERPVTSVVLQPTDAAFVECQRQGLAGERALPEKDRALLAVLADAPGQQITYTEWLNASGLPGSTFDRVRGKLIDRGLVRPLGNRGYALTPISPPIDPHGGNAPTPIPLREMGVGVDSGVEDEDDDEIPF